MSKSKIENRLNTMRHKQAQPTDSLILAESAEGKDFSQELSKAQPFDEIPSLTEKQVAFGMCNPQAHLDAKQALHDRGRIYEYIHDSQIRASGVTTQHAFEFG